MVEEYNERDIVLIYLAENILNNINQNSSIREKLTKYQSMRYTIYFTIIKHIESGYINSIVVNVPPAIIHQHGSSVIYTAIFASR